MSGERDKLERRAALAASIAAGQQRALADDAVSEPRTELERLLSPGGLRELDAAVLEVVRANLDEPEPELGVGDQLVLAKQEQRQRTLDAVLGRRPTPEDVPRRTSSFDGGARQTVPPPADPERDHNELVSAAARILRLGHAGDVFSV